jgi:putative intracellular protease/amidase
MKNRTAHVGVHDGLSDWEVGHLLAELHSGRFTGVRFEVVSVAETLEPVTTMGGVRIVPDAELSELEPATSEILILPGGDMWDAGGGQAFAEAAGRFLEAGVPVAAICGATAGLARAGLLDERNHTSAALDYLTMTGYDGSARYMDRRAVVDGDLITAGPQSPVQFACTALGRLGVADESTLQAYERLFAQGDASVFPVLMEAQTEADSALAGG